jgi:choline dehydrogenase-like flavoprotein
MAESYDVCIIGSGAGGGAAAYGLTKAGLSVLVLEKGPHYTEKDFFHDELTVCRRSFFVPNPVDEPHMIVREGKAERTSDGWISCCVGGGTVHMSGYFFRLHKEDFKLKTLYGAIAGAEIADWPIAYEELEPYYDEVERVIGVSGDAARNPNEPRRKPYPLQPLLAHPCAELVERAAKKIGLVAFPTPRAVLSGDYAGRSACAYCGFCGSYGCEIGAKSSTLASLLAIAKKSGKLTLRARATATRVTTDARGRARSVVWLDERGQENETRARAIVVACSAIESARLLLASASPQHPNGLANSSGQLGKNLLFATFAAGFARFSRPAEHFPAEAERLIFLDRTVQDLYVAPRANLPHPKAGTIIFQRAHPNPIFQAERLAKNPDGTLVFGSELIKRMREFFRETHTIEWETFTEFLPSPRAEVTLDPNVRDKAGHPVARIKIGVHPASLAASDFLAGKAREVLGAASAAKQGPLAQDRVYFPLQAGTARMGADPSRSVLDATGRAHDVKNLYVADASGFVSSGGAPFTLTIMANALRVAASLAERAARREL